MITPVPEFNGVIHPVRVLGAVASEVSGVKEKECGAWWG